MTSRLISQNSIDLRVRNHYLLNIKRLLFSVFQKNIRISMHAKLLLFYYFLEFSFDFLMVLGISYSISSEDPLNYAHFVFPALGATRITSSALFAPRNFIESEANRGTLEQISMSSISMTLLTFIESIWPIVKGLLFSGIYLVISIVSAFSSSASISSNLYRLMPSFSKLVSISAAVLILIGQFWSLGLVSAGISLISRRGHFINVLLISAITLLSGVYFSLEKLPRFLQLASQISSLTLLNKALRGPVSWFEISSFSIFTFLQIILLTKFFGACFNRARIEGALAL